MNILSHHIPFATLVDLAEGRLPTEGRAELLAHMSSCSRCAAQAARMEQTIELMRADKSEDAPSHLLAGAMRLFRARPATVETPSGVRRMLAALRFDSKQRSPAFAVRAGQPASARRLLFDAGKNDIDVRIKARGDEWIVAGQVFGECSGADIELRGATEVVREQLNESCEFTFPAVSAGMYTLHIRLGDAEIEIPDIKLG